MAKPTAGCRRNFKRLARYLLGSPRVVCKYEYQERPEGVDGYSDSDWAGCKKSGKSTSGGAMMIGSHMVKSWSATQKNITLSSAEAELIAAVKMSTELIGLTQLLEDWGAVTKGTVHVDSTAAIGVVSRRGSGS